MAITPAQIINNQDLVDRNSYTTASISPVAGRLYIATITNRNTSTPPTPTVSGAGLTWVQMDTDTIDSALKRVTTFRALGYSPSSGALTIGMGGTTITECAWIVDEYAGVDQGGTNGSGAFIQSSSTKDDSGAATSISATLSAFKSTLNLAVGCAAKNSNAETMTAGSGFTKLAEQQLSENAIDSATEYKLNSTTVNFTWTTAGRAIIFAYELSEAVQPVGFVAPNPRAIIRPIRPPLGAFGVARTVLVIAPPLNPVGIVPLRCPAIIIYRRVRIY